MLSYFELKVPLNTREKCLNGEVSYNKRARFQLNTQAVLYNVEKFGIKQKVLRRKAKFN